MTAIAASPNLSLLFCGNCRATMQRVALAGHYGAGVELDLCMCLQPGLVRRRRERAAKMDEARQRRGHGRMSIDWSSVVEHGRRPIRAAMIGVAIWLVGRFWR